MKLLEESSGQTRQGVSAEQDRLALYGALCRTRLVDDALVRLQRQGQTCTYPPSLGQEATQVGAVAALRSSDWYCPSYRALGALLWRGFSIEQVMWHFAGYPEANRPPASSLTLPMTVAVGGHVPVALGLAWQAQTAGDDRVALVSFGDGALSQGVVNESLNFAAVFKLPVIFVCENNGYAISTPTRAQTAIPELRQRALGFGVAETRVDGNDVLAMRQATAEAVQSARCGAGPHFIEAVTYRLGMHTTADDPSLYRDPAEVEHWKTQCPITRLGDALTRLGVSVATLDAIKEACAQEVRLARERFSNPPSTSPADIFAHRFASSNEQLEREKDAFIAACLQV